MPETKSIRVNDSDDPDRQTKFDRALRDTACNGNVVIRRLIDAWLAYVAEHDAAPSFPVRISPVGKGKR